MPPAIQHRGQWHGLSKGGQRWVEFIVEVQHHRGWSVLRTFRDIEECRRFLAEQPDDHAIELGGKSLITILCTEGSVVPADTDVFSFRPMHETSAAPIQQSCRRLATLEPHLMCFCVGKRTRTVDHEESVLLLKLSGIFATFVP